MRQNAARKDDPGRPGRRRRPGVGLLLALVLLSGAVTLGIFWVQGREVVAPPWLRDRIAAELARALPDMQVSFGDVVALVDENWRPRVAVRDLQLRTPEGADILSVADVRARLDGSALLERRLALRSLDARGVHVTMQRSPDGAISLRAGTRGGALRRQAPNLLRLVSDLDDVLLRPVSAGLRRIDVSDVALLYEDQRAERTWTVEGGHLRLDRDGPDLRITVDLSLLGGASGEARLAANYAGTIGAQGADFGITIDNLDARDIATQGPEFAWLRVLEAPISGALRGGVNAEGRFDPLNATLRIGAGIIQPTPQAQPIPIESAASAFAYLPDQRLLRFDSFGVQSAWGTGELRGHAQIGLRPDGQLDALVGQVRLTDLRVNPDGLYAEPVEIAAAELDFRMRPAPFALDIGRFELSDQGQVLTAQGRVSVGNAGWDIALDGQLDGLAASRLVALWPERFKPRTRGWIAENVREGRIAAATGALRFAQGEAPDLFLGFEYENATFTFTDNLPPVEKARGHAALDANRFSLVLNAGEVTAPEGGTVTAGGTAFIVPDTKAKPDPPGIVRLSAAGPVTAALSLLDQPPLRVMQKADLPVALAQGQVAVAGTLSLPLKKRIPPEEVDFDVAGTVSAVRSTRLVKDREIAAERLALAASEREVSLAGAATLDGVPLELVWRQEIGGRPGEALPGTVTGRIEITPAALETFDIALPPGTVEGRTSAQLRLDLLKGTPPRLSLRSDMVGARLSLPQVGWSKPAERAGDLVVEMTLGDAPSVDVLSIAAPELSATGSISLTAEQTLDRIRFDRVQIGGWLDAPVDLVSRGEGTPPAVVVRGGTVDLRRVDLPEGGGRDGESAPLTVALDRLQISDTIALTSVTGSFSAGGGLEGDFRGQVNGSAPVTGRMTPLEGRSAIRVVADDAGGVLKAAGLLREARAGKFDLVLVPVGTEGAFDGRLVVTDASITRAPALAALLNGISVVGLINELNGDGIFFSEVTADFRMTPSRITLREAAAVGASMGLSMDGTFEPDTRRLDMRGVISPVYLLNAIGSVLTRKGEGLFGFNYSITGTTDEPKVFVNPLTALAPGMLRNLFRRGEPEVPLEEGETKPEAPERRIPEPVRGDER